VKEPVKKIEENKIIFEKIKEPEYEKPAVFQKPLGFTKTVVIMRDLPLYFRIKKTKRL
jgi:hypothetical protein